MVPGEIVCLEKAISLLTKNVCISVMDGVRCGSALLSLLAMHENWLMSVCVRKELQVLRQRQTKRLEDWLKGKLLGLSMGTFKRFSSHR